MNFDETDFTIGLILGILVGLFWGVFWSDWRPAIAYAFVSIVLIIPVVLYKVRSLRQRSKRR